MDTDKTVDNIDNLGILKKLKSLYLIPPTINYGFFVSVVYLEVQSSPVNCGL